MKHPDKPLIINKAEVFNNGTPAGILEKKDGEFLFRYHDSYILNSTEPPVSLSLPKRRRLYRSKFLFPFFFGLLSEGSNRQLQNRLLRIDERDHFSLLLATAHTDTIGAVTVRPFAE